MDIKKIIKSITTAEDGTPVRRFAWPVIAVIAVFVIAGGLHLLYG